MVAGWGPGNGQKLFGRHLLLLLRLRIERWQRELCVAFSPAKVIIICIIDPRSAGQLSHRPMCYCLRPVARLKRRPPVVYFAW